MEFVSASVASKTLGVTVDTLRDWAKAGKIPHVKSPGGRFSYDLAAYLNGAGCNPSIPASQPEPTRTAAPVAASASPGNTGTYRRWLRPRMIFRVAACITIAGLFFAGAFWANPVQDRLKLAETVEAVPTSSVHAKPRQKVERRPVPKPSKKAPHHQSPFW